MNRGIHILMIGDAESLPLVGSGQAAHVGECDMVGGVDAAIAELTEATGKEKFYDLIALIIRRRGELTPADITRLARQTPLSHMAVISGPWCEGPWRRGIDLLTGVTVVPWHRWDGWLRSNADTIRAGLPSAWSLPATAGADEMSEFWSRRRVEHSHSRELIAIETTDPDAAETIGDMLALAGYAASWRSPAAEGWVNNAAAWVVEANGWDEQVRRHVASLKERSPAAPIFLLANFPLPADVESARQAGVAAVLGKPFTLNEFLGQLKAIMAQRPSAARGAAIGNSATGEGAAA